MKNIKVAIRERNQTLNRMKLLSEECPEIVKSVKEPPDPEPNNEQEESAEDSVIDVLAVSPSSLS